MGTLNPKEKPVIVYPSVGRYDQTQYPQIPPGYSVPMHHVAHSPSFHSQGNYQIYALNPHSDSCNAYYYQNPYLPMIPEPKKTTTFGRVMLILMILLVVVGIMCTMKSSHVLFGTYIPGFQVTSLNLSNFTATGRPFTGKWGANVSVANLNEDLEIHLSKVKSRVFYREAMTGIASPR